MGLTCLIKLVSFFTFNLYNIARYTYQPMVGLSSTVNGLLQMIHWTPDTSRDYSASKCSCVGHIDAVVIATLYGIRSSGLSSTFYHVGLPQPNLISVRLLRATINN